MDESEDTLRSLAVHDEKVVRSVLASGLETLDALGIDAKTYALVRLGVLICLDAPCACRSTGGPSRCAAAHRGR